MVKGKGRPRPKTWIVLRIGTGYPDLGLELAKKSCSQATVNLDDLFDRRLATCMLVL